MFLLKHCVLFNSVLFSKVQYQKYVAKIRTDKEITEKEKDAEKKRVTKLESDLELYNREIQNLKEDKVDYTVLCTKRSKKVVLY